MLLVLTATGASAFEYGSPVNYEIMLAGNFGEPRPNHFHGGIDIKTDGVEGKPIFSIGDGYVSQVSIGVAGFGNAVYAAMGQAFYLLWTADEGKDKWLNDTAALKTALLVFLFLWVRLQAGV